MNATKMRAKSHGTKAAFLTSLMSLILCFTMLVGTTLAWFTDTVTSGENQIIAGNLDVDAEYSTDGTTWNSLTDASSLFSTNLWEPGHTEVVYIKVVNKGTLAFNYSLKVSPVSEASGISVVNDEEFKLSDYLKFGTTEPSYTAVTKYATRDAAREDATVQGMQQSSLQQTGVLYSKSDADSEKAAQSEAYTALVVYMPEDVGNEANYKTGTTPPKINLGVTVYAWQEDYEEDSFGKDYDVQDANANGPKDNSENVYITSVSKSAQIHKDSDDTTTTDSNVDISQEGDVTLKTDTKVTGTDTPQAQVVIPAAAIENGDHTVVLNVYVDEVEDANFTAAEEDTQIAAGERETVTYEVNVVKDGVKVTSTDGIFYTVDMFVGKDLKNLAMYHRSDVMTKIELDVAFSANNQFKYNSTTGFVTMYVKDFSPFTAVYDVASTQGTAENPFVISNGEEWTAAPSVATSSDKTYFIVTADFDLTGDQTMNVPANRNLSIDMQNHQVSGNGNYGLVFNYGTLELKNGRLDTLKQDEYNCVWNYGTMVLNTVNIDSTYHGVFNANENSSTPAELSITNCRIYGNKTAVYNGSYSGSYYDDNYATTGYGNVEIFSGEFKSCGFDSDNFGGEAIHSCDGAGNVTIHAGTFIYAESWDDLIPVGMLAADSTFTNMYKQTNSLNSSAEDYVSIVAQSNEMECTLQFEGEEEVEYASLANAYAQYEADGRNATLKLKKNVVNNLFDLFHMPVMSIDDSMGDLTIDLNGYTFQKIEYSIGNSRYPGETGVNLTIKDSSEGQTGCYYVNNFDGIMTLVGGTATISSGTIKRDTTTNAKNYFYMNSGSTLYITGGAFVENKTKNTTNRTLFSFASVTDAKVVISGGTFDGVEFAATQDFIDNCLSKISKAATNYQLNFTIVGSTIEITQSKK